MTTTPAYRPTSFGGSGELIAEIARHELALVLRTRRAAALLILYLATAAVSGLAYVLMVRFIEQQALALLIGGGMSPTAAEGALHLGSNQAYTQLVAFFAGVAPESIDPLIRDSVVLPALLWGSLAFLPFVIVLTSFDQVAADLASRSILYSVLRAPRHVVLLGKMAAQTVLFTVLTVAAALILMVIASTFLQTFVPAAALAGAMRIALLLVPYGICYLGMSALASSSVRQPTLALFAAIAIMLALRLVGLCVYIPADSNYAWLRFLAYLSPARYHDGLWQSGLAGPLTSSAVYLALGGIFTALAAWRLAERDL